MTLLSINRLSSFFLLVFFLMIRRPPRSTLDRSSAASDVYKRQVHKYELPQSSSSNDTLNLLLQEKLNQISQLNLYEKELEDYYKRVRNKENNALNDIPNKIILDQSKRLSAKGYTQEDATAFFESDCPEIRDQKFIDFRFNFLSTEMISEIYCLRLSIYKKSNDKYLQSYFDDFFGSCLLSIIVCTRIEFRFTE